MRFRQLEYFLAICEHGSFTAAAAKLYLAQPSLSQQIGALERELGADLFERGRSGVSLTPAGRVFRPHARAVVDAIDQAQRAVADVVAGHEGELHVLTIRSVASGVLPAAIARWHERYPATVLRLHDYSHRRDLEAAVREGRGDLAIGPRPPNWEGPVESLGFEELVVAGRGPFLEQAASAAELRTAKWVHFEPEQGMAEVLDWAASALDFTPRVVARVGQVAAALNLAVEGVGLALVPANAVPATWQAHVRPTQPPLLREITVYSRAPMAQLTARFVQILGEVTLPITSAAEVPSGAVLR
ncbi:LysR family transcriptional regulator [Nocardia sp. NPDC050697]|uniref:LysR family transcriptional regulator n=1 Tax=Nocardia sp. NPDC050697 TaxID=3155158 RepID=UPI0033DC47C5